MPEDYSNNTITFSMEEVREADMKAHPADGLRRAEGEGV